MTKFDEIAVRKNIKIYYLYTFLNSLHFTWGLWVLFLQSRGLTLAQVGIAEACYHGAALLGEIPTGIVADRFGRKVSLAIGLVVYVLSDLVQVTSRSPWQFALGFALCGLATTFASGAAQALLYDSCKAVGEEARYLHHTSQNLAVLSFAVASAKLFGNALGNVNFTWAYLAQIAAEVITLGCIMAFHEPPRGISATQDDRPHLLDIWRSSVATLKNGTVRWLMIYTALFFGLTTVAHLSSQPYWISRGFSVLGVGVIAFAGEMAICASLPFSPRLKRHYQRLKPIIPAAIAALILLTVGVKNPLIAVVVFSLSDVLCYIMEPLLDEEMQNLVSSESRATALSTLSAIESLVVMIGFYLSGLVADRWSLPVVYVGVSALILGFAVITSFVKPTAKQISANASE
jgi:MFS family permease